MLSENDSAGFEGLKVEIISKAEKEAEFIISKAEKEAEFIISKAYVEAKEKEESAKIESESEMEIEKRRTLWASTAENRKELLDAREEFISQVFEKAYDRIVERSRKIDQDHEKLLIDLIREGTKSIGEQKIRIVSNKIDTAFLRKHIQKLRATLGKYLGYKVDIDLTGDPLDYVGGVVISSLDEKICYNNTLEARLSEARDRLRFKVTKILFAE